MARRRSRAPRGRQRRSRVHRTGQHPPPLTVVSTVARLDGEGRADILRLSLLVKREAWRMRVTVENLALSDHVICVDAHATPAVRETDARADGGYKGCVLYNTRCD